MAKRKQEEAKPGAPAWMATFSDLMNLLLCFFVLLFSMSSVDAEKFEQLVASLQSSFSVLPAGGSSIGEGNMVSSGISQLENLDIFYKESNSSSDVNSEEESEEDLKKQYQEAALAESDQMAENIESQLNQQGIADRIEVDVNGQFVRLTLSGALLFDTGKSTIREDAIPLVEKMTAIVGSYADNRIDIEGHTDNVPINNDKFENNDVLSSYRALSVKDYFVENGGMNPANIKAVSCGDSNPAADNATEDGRARNRRVEIKIYNSYGVY